MKRNIRYKNVIIKTATNVFTPITLMYGAYIIIHGHLNVGSGLQGGILLAASTILIYLGYGEEKSEKIFKLDTLIRNGVVGGILYTLLGLVGIFFFTNFGKNVFFDVGEIGDLISTGSIFIMSILTGFIVFTSASYLVLAMLGLKDVEKLSNIDNDNKE